MTLRPGTAEGSSGVRPTPLSILWPCPLSVSEYAAAGKKIEVPEQVCPGCGRRLGGWSGYKRPVRAGRDYRVWIRRGRCKPCNRTHALLPDFVHERRYDAVEVIGGALEMSIEGRGMKKVAEDFGVPHSTARDWRRRHRARAPSLVMHFADLTTRLGASVGEVSTESEQAALSLLKAAWRRASEILAIAALGLWRFWNAMCGGQALGTNTIPPLLATEESSSMRG